MLTYRDFSCLPVLHHHMVIHIIKIVLRLLCGTQCMAVEYLGLIIIPFCKSTGQHAIVYANIAAHHLFLPPIDDQQRTENALNVEQSLVPSSSCKASDPCRLYPYCSSGSASSIWLLV